MITCYATSELAKLFKVDERTVRRWVTDKQLVGCECPHLKGYAIPEEYIIKFALDPTIANKYPEVIKWARERILKHLPGENNDEK